MIRDCRLIVSYSRQPARRPEAPPPFSQKQNRRPTGPHWRRDEPAPLRSSRCHYQAPPASAQAAVKKLCQQNRPSSMHEIEPTRFRGRLVISDAPETMPTLCRPVHVLAVYHKSGRQGPPQTAFKHEQAITPNACHGELRSRARRAPAAERYAELYGKAPAGLLRGIVQNLSFPAGMAFGRPPPNVASTKMPETFSLR